MKHTGHIRTETRAFAIAPSAFDDGVLSETLITASIGVATLPRHASGAEELVSRADHALYTAKQRGKDRVEVFGA